jgi:hypothetical protein
MDGNRFDSLARAFASGMSRRSALRALASGAGASVLGAVGLAQSRAFAETDATLELAKTPEMEREGSGVKLRIELKVAMPCVVEYSDNENLGKEDVEPKTPEPKKVESKDVEIRHEVVLPDLKSDTPYYFRVVVLTNKGELASKVYKFTLPDCPDATQLCNGTCVPSCGDTAALDPSTCTCICAPGFASCPGDSTNGTQSAPCSTPITTVDNCLACGAKCDDGNACTDNICDPVAGCVTSNVANGVACGSSGTCVDGACSDCVPGGSCAADTECCDDELCCNGTCVAKSAFLDDVNNCGVCGTVCESSPCQTAICVEGICQSEPIADGETCDDGNPCTVDDHCMAGACMGNPVPNGDACGEGGTCSDGICVECESGGACSADTDCCAEEICCNDVCVAKASFQDDADNCGGCGKVCEASDNPCEQSICKQGECVIEDADEGDTCESDNPCVKDSVCQEGLCQGTPVENATPCGDLGMCEDGQCIEPDDFEAGVHATIFSDDFEKGQLTGWTSAQGVSVQQSVVAGGTYAARATGNGTVAYARKTLSSAQQEVFVRTRFQIISQGSNSVYLIRTFRSSSSPLISVFVSSSGRISFFNNVTGTTSTSSTTIPKGMWHELELRVRVNGTRSLATIWLNGSKLYDVSRTVSLGSGGTRIVQIGDNVVRRTFDVAFDDVAVCTGGLCPDLAPPGTSRAPGAATSVLLATYAHNSTLRGGVSWEYVVYRPRQVQAGLVINDPTRGELRVDNAGAYHGWDVLPTFNYSVHRIETGSIWTVLELNRAATVAIVWRGGVTLPSWLSGWAKAGNVTISGNSFPTYRKSFGRGKISLGGVYSPTDQPGNITRDTYWILLAESDGLPSPAPIVPGGKAAPIPNETCPAWVHDQYVATGPDGATYPTWHHLIDPVYWCYHRHEHGSNPRWFGGGKKPVFEYTASKHGMTEAHAGFKNFVLDSEDGTRWMITHHFGTAGLARACSRFHTVDIAVKSIATGELLADLHFMGDFGMSIVNRTHVPLTPPTCPDQASLASDSHGVRMLPSAADGAVGYEPWRVDTSNLVFGFIASFTVNNPDAMVICNNSICDQPVVTGGSGSKRFFSPNGDADGNRFGIIAGEISGEFYTDVHGTKMLRSNDTGAVRQYLKPGAKMQVLSSTSEYYDLNAWGKKFVPTDIDGNPTNREGSIQAPN